MEYLVLRKSSQSTQATESSPVAGPAVLSGDYVPVSASGGGSGLEISVEDLSANDVADLSSNPEVEMAAENMPISLFEPLGVGADSDASAAGSDSVTWGVSAVAADTSGFTGNGVKVAVLDTGIDKDHLAFSGVNIIGDNFTNEPGDFSDSHGHGTHCAGTIFGRDINGQRIGVAPGVTDAIICKVIGAGGSTGVLYKAMNWALEQGANIISMSLGFDVSRHRQILTGQGVHPQEADSRALKALVDNVRLFDNYASMLKVSGGVIGSAAVFAATGNASDRRGTRAGGAPFVINSSYPAEAPDFHAIGALALENSASPSGPFRVADFSNDGALMVAPGVDILSAAAGADNSALRLDSGTSMATPHVAGIAALWTEKLMLTGSAEPEDIVRHVLDSASLPAGLSGTAVGRGMPQAPQD